MCGSMQKAAAKVLRKWMVDHGIPAEIIEMLLGPELPDDDARPGLPPSTSTGVGSTLGW